MKILNQDKDHYYRVTEAYHKEKYYKDTFMGYNVYGRIGKRTVLLGTYDTEEDARQLVGEINLLIEKGSQSYQMPEPALEIEDYGVIV